MSIRIRLGGFALPLFLAAAATAQSAGPIQFVPRAQLSGSATAQFGGAMSLAGDDLLVDAFGWAPSLAPHQYVFHRSGGVWSQQASFDFDTTGGPFCMASSTPLSIEGDVLAIGTGRTPYPFGRAWISRRTGSTWGAPTFVEDASQNYYFFGQAVLLHGGALFAGAPNDYFPGEVLEFLDSGSGYQQQAAFGGGFAHFGAALVASGDTLAVAEEDRVDVYARGSTILQWNFQASLVPPGAAAVRAVALDGDTAVVSTLFPGCGAVSTFGVYVYERSGTSWAQTATLTGGGTAAEFGRAVAVHGDTICIGAATASTNHTGTVDVFRRAGSAWVRAARLAPNPALPADSYFGDALALDGGTLCAGAPGLTANPGEVQVFDVVQLPPPQTYCTAKVNSLGCLPAASTNGIPSATNPNPFRVNATQVINNKTGFLVYTTAGAASTPYQGGTLCVAQPFRRLPPQSSGGNPPPNDCSGVYSVDFNARIRSGIDPALLPGVQVWAQWITRDPADPFHVGLTDAATFVIGS